MVLTIRVVPYLNIPVCHATSIIMLRKIAFSIALLALELTIFIADVMSVNVLNIYEEIHSYMQIIFFIISITTILNLYFEMLVLDIVRKRGSCIVQLLPWLVLHGFIILLSGALPLLAIQFLQLSCLMINAIAIASLVYTGYRAFEWILVLNCYIDLRHNIVNTRKEIIPTKQKK